MVFDAKSQEDTLMNAWMELSLEDLLALQINVASKSKSTTRETPGSISVVTDEDIRNNFCRDLVDVFNLVPGFNISKDDDYTTFLSRGLFGFEGRTLIMVNGMQLSDLYFGSYIIGNDFPIQLIKRIEIIRGPGSVIYGGTAELAVINIVTYTGEEIQGSDVVVRYGHLSKKFGHSDVGFMAGMKNELFDLSIIGAYGKALRTDGEAKYINNDLTYDHNYTSAGIESKSFLISGKYKEKTHFSLLYNEYTNNQVRRFKLAETTDIDNNTFSTLTEAFENRKVSYTHSTLGAQLFREFTIKDMVITNGISYQYSYPFERKPTREEVYTQRIKPYLFGVYNWKKFEITLGTEYFLDYSKINRPEESLPLDFLRKSIDDQGRDEIGISNFAAYSNLKYKILDAKWKILLNLGARYDYNELYGKKLNPRIALNAYGDMFFFKLIYSSAYRAPLVANNAFSRYGLNPDTALNSRPIEGVKPEDTKVFEMEVNCKIQDAFIMTLNAFYQEVNNIIEFRYNYLNDDLYSDNGGKIGTYGGEFELKYLNKKYKAVGNISWAKPRFFKNNNEWAYSYEDARGGDTYITPDNEDGYPTNLHLLGLPEIKVYSNHTFIFSKNISASFNGLYLSERWAYDGSAKSKRIESQVIFGVGLEYQNDFLTLMLSVHDIFNQRQDIATSWYDGGYDILHYKGREISLGMRFKF